MDVFEELDWITDWVHRLEQLWPQPAPGRCAWPFAYEPFEELGPWGRPGLAAEVVDEQTLIRAFVERLRPRDPAADQFALRQRPALFYAANGAGPRAASRVDAVMVESYRELALAHPTRAAALAAEAVRQLGQSSDTPGSPERIATEALALAYLADAQRFTGALTQAERTFAAAESLLPHADPQRPVARRGAFGFRHRSRRAPRLPPQEHALTTLLRLRALLARNHGQVTEAVALLERAAEVAAAVPLERAEVLAQQVALEAWIEDLPAASAKLETLYTLLPQIDGGYALSYLILHNAHATAVYHTDPNPALAQLAEMDAADSPFDAPFFGAHRQWVRARLLANRGETMPAREQLRAAFTTFLELGRADWALRALGDVVLLATRHDSGERLVPVVELTGCLLESPAYPWVRTLEQLRWQRITEHRKAVLAARRAAVGTMTAH